jgi:hypothetical protein
MRKRNSFADKHFQTAWISTVFFIIVVLHKLPPTNDFLISVRNFTTTSDNQMKDSISS